MFHHLIGVHQYLSYKHLYLLSQTGKLNLKNSKRAIRQQERYKRYVTAEYFCCLGSLAQCPFFEAEL